MPLTDAIRWGLKRSFTPNFGARLVQEGNRLHYLADRANITGKFVDAEGSSIPAFYPPDGADAEHWGTESPPCALRHPVS